MRSVNTSHLRSISGQVVAKHKPAAETPMDSERHFRAMIETLTHGVVCIDKNSRICLSNPAAERILGVSLAEMKGRDANDVRWQTYGDDGKPFTAENNPSSIALRTGLTVRNVAMAVFNPQLNRHCWLSVDAVPQFEGDDPTPSHVYATFSDITEHKRAEKALRDSQAHLALAQRVASIGSVFLDLNTGGLEWSDEMYNVYGFDKATFSPTFDRVLAVVHPEDRERLTRCIAAEREDVGTDPIEFRILRPDGQLRVLHRESVTVRDERGQATGILATNRDITEKKSALTALSRSQAHLALAQRVARVGSTIIDFRTGEWEWSDETYRIFGVAKESFQPSLDAMATLVHADDRDVFRESVMVMQSGVVPHPLEFRVRMPDGKDQIFFLEIDLIEDDAGVVTGAIMTSSDITVLRAAEKKQQLLQNQLYHAQRLDSLGTLAGGIAHDLNNTLVPILGLSEAMLKAPAAADSNRPLLEVIHQAGVRARDLVRQILAFSRRENPNNRALELSSFVRETMRLARASVPTTITIEERIAEVPAICGDSSQLHQVLLNLIANAAQAIGDDIGTITVEVAQCGKKSLDEHDGNLDFPVRISVWDTGAGMSEETQKRIFEPFFTTKKVGVGTGLGLSVVHGIVAAHGGRICVASKLGQGSRFDVFLPTISLEPV